MKSKLLVSFLVFSGILHAQNTWVQKTQFPGMARLAPAGFAIGTKIYMGTGYNNLNDTVLKDFWEWDQATDVWTQKKDFDGMARGWATGFAIGSKGYFGTGGDGGNPIFTDWWEYDPATDKWTQKAAFAGTPASETASFSIGSKGYVLGRVNDFWEYDPSSNMWTQKKDYPGCAIPVGFSIGNKGYLGTGQFSSSTYCNDFWEYDPATDTWTKKTNVGGVPRVAAVAFSIGPYGYIGTGADVTDVKQKDFWQYDPSTNSWIKRANFGGTARLVAIGFSIGTKGYLGTGFDNSGDRKDFWEYGAVGNAIVSINDASDIGFAPNPFSSETILKMNEELKDASLILYNALGQEVKKINHISGNELRIQRDNLPAGIYFLSLSSEKGFLFSDRLIIAD